MCLEGGLPLRCGMAAADDTCLVLLPHPDGPAPPVRGVAVRVRLRAPQVLRLHYELQADPEQVRIPTTVPGGGRADRLWAHTCFEAFIQAEGSTGYLELNFSPSGQWAAYRFQSYRQGMAAAELREPPRVALRRAGDRLVLEAEVRLGGAGPEGGPATIDAATRSGGVRLAVSAVVEDQQGRLSYWALRHPPGRPDFHHPHSFSLALSRNTAQ